MKNTFKYVALAALGLTGSSVVIAASISGDTVAGSSGVMAIAGTVITTTCAASIDSTDHSFVMVSNEVAGKTTGDVLAEPGSTIMLTGCNGQNITATANANNRIDEWHGRFDGVTGNDLVRFQVAVAGEGITGGAEGRGQAGSHRFPLNGSAPNIPLVINVNSDNYMLKLTTQIQKSFAAATSLGDMTDLAASYTYSMTYL